MKEMKLTSIAKWNQIAKYEMKELFQKKIKIK
jgi:hypothetical protein